jgi:hypothetical protein
VEFEQTGILRALGKGCAVMTSIVADLSGGLECRWSGGLTVGVDCSKALHS